MNISIVDIAFIFSGFVFAIAAISGETWLKGNDSTLKKITLRGWISIFALIVTLVCGFAKENNVSKKEKTAEESIKNLSMQLYIANQKLKEAEKSAVKAEDDRQRIKKELLELQKQNDLTHRAMEKSGVEFSRDENAKRKGIVHRVHIKDGIIVSDSLDVPNKSSEE